MPTKPLDRLLFAQGGNCFFCRKPLGKTEASVEHLVAATHGGKNNDENCVACCKALNTLFGRMSLKEKLHIVLNQRGAFVCPSAAPGSAAPPAKAKPAEPKRRTHTQRFELVVADLQKRGNARPGTAEKLLNTIKSHMLQLGELPCETDKLLGELRAKNYVSIADGKVSYALPAKDA